MTDHAYSPLPAARKSSFSWGFAFGWIMVVLVLVALFSAVFLPTQAATGNHVRDAALLARGEAA